MARILVVDDNCPLAEDLVEICREEGHEARHACHPREALEMAASFAYSLALIDLRMPVIDGLELVRRLREKHGEAEHVLMTAYGSEADLDAARQRGMRVLNKPVDIQVVLELARSTGR